MTHQEILSTIERIVQFVRDEKTLISQAALSNKEALAVQIIKTLAGKVAEMKKEFGEVKTYQSLRRIQDFRDIVSLIKTKLIEQIGISEKDILEINRNAPFKSRSLLSILDRKHNENTHSDYIAPFFRSDFIGLTCAVKNYSTFMSAAGYGVGLDKGRIVLLKAYREFRLDSLSQRRELSDKRIDILVVASFENGTEEYLAIENKIYSGESEDQTTHYATGLMEKLNGSGGRIKRCSGILLSIHGRLPISDRFKPVSYRDLFRIILQSRDSTADAMTRKYCDLYLFELASSVLEGQWLFNIPT